MPTLEYIRQKIKELDNDYDVRPGTVIDDIVVKPQSVIMAPLVNTIEEIRQNQSVLSHGIMSESAYDELMANLLVDRTTGVYSVTSVRIFYEEPISLIINVGDGFLTSDNLRFKAIGTQNITTEIMASRMADDGLFYVDVPLVAEKPGEEYEVAADTITRVENPIAQYVKATNPFPASAGRARETNLEVFNRSKQAVTARDIVTDRGASFLITQNFPNISQVKTIGFNEAEMYRDILIGHHIGGYTDIYVKTISTGTGGEILIENVQPDAITGEIHIDIGSNGDLTDVPVLAIEDVQLGSVSGGIFEVYCTGGILERYPVVDVSVPDELKWVYRNLDVLAITGDRTVAGRHIRYSEREQWQIRLHGSHAGKSVRIIYSWMHEVQTIQDYIDTTERVVSEDTLAKSFVPAYVDMDVEVETTPGLSGVPDYVESISQFINSQDVGQELEVSDIINVLYDAGAQKVTLPLVVTARIQHLDGTIESVESDNVISIEDDPEKPVTKRIVRFFPGDITVTVV